MKFAASLLALPAVDHLGLLPGLRPIGLTGIEVLPSRVWPDWPSGFDARAVADYRYEVSEAGLDVIGLDGLLDGCPLLGLFKDREAQAKTADLLVQLSAVCRDLGGRTLIWGGPRWRGDLSSVDAWETCRSFLEGLLPRIEPHGTVLCFSPLGPEDGNFCSTARECRMLVNHLDHPSFGLHLSAQAQAANGETGHAPFSAVRDRLDHFHADEPAWDPFGTSGTIDHADCRRHLAAISYRKWVTLKQREAVDPLRGLAQSASRLLESYLREDNLAMRHRRYRLAPVSRPRAVSLHG